MVMQNDGALAYAQWLHEAGRLDEAAEAYHGILKRDRANPDALRGIAHLQAARGEYPRAAANLARAARASPRVPALQLELAQFQYLAGEYTSASRACEAFLKQQPHDLAALCLRAGLREHAGDFDGAVAAYRQALALAPDDPAILNNCGLALRATGDYEGALACYAQALRAKPDSVAAWCNRGNALRELQRETEALACFDEALRVAPDAASAHFNRGLVLQQIGRLPEAIASFEKALAADPGYDEATLQIAESQLSLGDFAAATERLESILTRDASHAGANYLLTSTRRLVAADRPLIAALEQARKRHAIGAEAQVRLDFALGKAYDDLGEFERAFSCYERGNRGQRLRLHSRAAYTVDAFEELLTADENTWQPRGELPFAHGEGLVFVVGMPRSGTTLVEQILASHSAVHGAGETGFFERALLQRGWFAGVGSGPLVAAHRTSAELGALGAEIAACLRHDAPECLRWVDKTPGHFAWLGLIQRLLPGARIVHCRRHPLDTCLSIYFQLFSTGHSYAYDLRDIARQFRAYHALMAHWRTHLGLRILDIHYEDVVRDTRGAAEALLALCDLPWEDACAVPHRTRRTVTTASRWQVRQPVHGQAQGRWRHYHARLAPAIEELGDLLADYPAPDV